ncbi:MAG: glycosyltransferase [Coleofasciculus sp. A1-SPW-01]|uniref:glycosyltransferase n=1 Tax=Coleofasciculus sp. A1-SPW-01 TaxID=3070819 RepID=UPI0033026043
MRILLISSVLPHNTTAGEVILYRHFSQLPNLSLHIVTDTSRKIPSLKIPSFDIVELQAHWFLNRFSCTRFSSLSHDVMQCIHPFFNYTQLREYIKTHKFDAILTVAEGIHWIAAQQISKESHIPLLTIFHDWWPNIAYIHPCLKSILEKRFKCLYQQSTVAFCVSEEMRRLLGTHPNAQILYPIPDLLNASAETHTRIGSQPFTLVYAGHLSHIYAPMLYSLSNCFQQFKELNLKLFGPYPDWSEARIQAMEEKNIYGGFISRNLLREKLKNASALLVTVSFEPKNRRWAETSFPSKLVEYCQFGKPIIVWGPAYSSAVKWAQKYQSALVVTSNSAQDVVIAFKDLLAQKSKQENLANKAIEMAKSIFNPKTIQQQFAESIRLVITQK